MTFLKRNRHSRGQTALETAFVFSSLIFITFALIQLALHFHTKTMATYAAFMAARSYQVLGDMANAEKFEEVDANGNKQRFLSDLKVVAPLRVAEDIFTCSLPWVTVPEGEGNVDFRDEASKPLPTIGKRCLEGKRRYEKFNVSKRLRFLTFDQSQSALNKNLEAVVGGFSEEGREPLRYGILNMRYQSPVPLNVLNVFDLKTADPVIAGLILYFVPGLQEDGFIRDEVYVPVLLNPGLNSGLEQQDTSKGKDINEEFKEQNR